MVAKVVILVSVWSGDRDELGPPKGRGMLLLLLSDLHLPYQSHGLAGWWEPAELFRQGGGHWLQCKNCDISVHLCDTSFVRMRRKMSGTGSQCCSNACQQSVWHFRWQIPRCSLNSSPFTGCSLRLVGFCCSVNKTFSSLPKMCQYLCFQSMTL